MKYSCTIKRDQNRVRYRSASLSLALLLALSSGRHLRKNRQDCRNARKEPLTRPSLACSRQERHVGIEAIGHHLPFAI